MRTFVLLLFTALLAPAFAAEPSYNFVQAGYQRIDFDVVPGLDVDGDGFGIGGSIEVADSFHVFGSYATADFDFGVDLDQLQIGAGYHTSIATSVDLVAAIAYVRAEASAQGFSIDDDGYGISLGLRGFVNEQFELAGGVDYVDFGNGGDDTSVGGAARYHVMPNLALEVNASVADDTSTFGVGVRLYFDM